MIKTKWIYCLICGNKTRTMIREDMELKNFPLYCPSVVEYEKLGQFRLVGTFAYLRTGLG